MELYEEMEKKLINDLIDIRKEKNISQEELAIMAGSSLQSISEFENHTHSPSIELFVNVTHALGYEVAITKQDA